jgi:hypothetical protein
MREKGEVHITFTPQVRNRFDLENLERFFFFNRNRLISLTREMKNRMDQELRRRGINVRNSRMEPDFQNFGLKYYAEYDPPKRYGVAIGPAIKAAIKTVIKAIIKAIKAVVKMVIQAIQAIVRFIQKLIVYIKNTLHMFNQALQKVQGFTFEGRESLDPNNPEAGLDNIEKEAEKRLDGNTSSGNTSSGNTSSVSPSNIFSSSNSWVILGGLGALALALIIALKK